MENSEIFSNLRRVEVEAKMFKLTVKKALNALMYSWPTFTSCIAKLAFFGLWTVSANVFCYHDTFPLYL